ncbi:MAG: hypothetical protein WDO24_12550 [Pseudomonadota bacterium]
MQVFKDNMIRADELTAQQAADQRLKDERSQRLDTLTRDFEVKSSSLVGILSAAATELNATAQSMSATAEETNAQSVAVAAASEQASANVQTVASATEELVASIHEIGSQVVQSAKVAADAVAAAAAHRRDRAEPGQQRPQDRRGGASDPGHREPDQSARAERDDRGGARR